MTWIIVSAALGALLVALVAFIIVRAIISRRSGNAHVGNGIDALIGARCTVEEKIDDAAGCGQVRVGVQSWSARAVDPDEVYEIGENLRIVAIEGVKLICRK